jgi:hypothetical protein
LVKAAVGGVFDGPLPPSPPQAANRAAPDTRMNAREERIVLVSSPRVKVQCVGNAAMVCNPTANPGARGVPPVGCQL